MSSDDAKQSFCLLEYLDFYSCPHDTRYYDRNGAKGFHFVHPLNSSDETDTL